MPRIYNALELELQRQRQPDQADPRSAAASRRKLGARDRHVVHRRFEARHAGHDTGSPITVPVGEGSLGRVFNVTGDPVDDRGPVNFDEALSDSSHGAGPDRSGHRARTILETGIKVIDLICPFTKGGKVGAFGGAGVGKTVVIMELINNIAKAARRFFRVRRRR